MRFPRLLSFFAILSLLGDVSCKKTFSGCHLLILSASSLYFPLIEAKESLETKLQCRLDFDFDSSGSLRRKIELGIPADLFLSADPRQLNSFQSKISDRKILAQNRLVLATSTSFLPKIALHGMDKWLNSSLKWGLGDPLHVPLGFYSREVLQKAKLWDAWKHRFVFFPNAKTTLKSIRERGVSLGILFQSDCLRESRVKIHFVFPKEWHSPILYEVAVFQKSRYLRQARLLFRELQEPSFQQKLVQQGFLTFAKESSL